MSESRGGDDNRVLIANCGLCDTRLRRFFVLVGLAGVVIGLCAAVVGFRSDVTPRVEVECVVCGRRWNAVPTVPSVYSLYVVVWSQTPQMLRPIPIVVASRV